MAKLRPRNRILLHAAVWLPAALAVSLPLDAEARDFRVNDIPNGQVFSCMNCHLDTSGTSFTPFGSDVRLHLVGNVPTAQKHVDWSAALCNRDSDGDSFSNAVELGDPNCTWTAGQPNPSAQVTNPGDPNSAPMGMGMNQCGNGTLDPGEDCDGTLLSHMQCSELGYGMGALSCTASCTFDTTGCSRPPSSSASTGVGGGGTGGSTGGCAVASFDPIGATGPAAILGSALALRTLRRRRRRVLNCRT